MEQTLMEIAKFHFILDEGRKGNHLLFTPEMIRQAFTHEPSELVRLFQAKLEEINTALNHTFTLQTFEEKRDFIRTLPGEVQDAMVYGYFQLLEGQDDAPERSVH